MKQPHARWAVATAGALALLLSSCGASEDGKSPGTESTSAEGGVQEITVWGHQGQESEVSALQEAIDGFNSSQTEVNATLQLVPEADYTSTVTTTSPDKLPDVLEYDGPMMASLVYAQKLQPIDDVVSADTISNQTASVMSQNTYPADGKLYGVSQFDASLGIYATRNC